MRIAVLGSGSGGNCTVITTPKTALLVDAGFGQRSTRRRLEQAGLGGTRVDAILLTHGHWDHASAAVSLSEDFAAPVFANQGTFEECFQLKFLKQKERFECGNSFTLGDITVEAFPVSHDAAEPVGFRFSWCGISGTLVTDLGELSPSVQRALDGCTWMVLESNHDEEMLKLGPYPWDLKQRVLSRTGHLSNQAVEVFLSSRFDGAASHLFLAHLSRQNNHPELALESAREALQASPRIRTEAQPQVYLTHQHKPSIVLTL